VLMFLTKILPMLGSAVQYVLFWVLTLVGSTALYRLYEKPVMDLRERFSAKMTI
jgi:hypothetical protein